MLNQQDATISGIQVRQGTPRYPPRPAARACMRNVTPLQGATTLTRPAIRNGIANMGTRPSKVSLAIDRTACAPVSTFVPSPNAVQCSPIQPVPAYRTSHNHQNPFNLSVHCIRTRDCSCFRFGSSKKCRVLNMTGVDLSFFDFTPL